MAKKYRHPAFLSFAGSSPSPAPRLYCFPYAGGMSSVFATWARSLAPAIDVVGVDLPGHGSRFPEMPLTCVREMAEEVAQALVTHGSASDVAFYGHSLGALVAFETARLLSPSVSERFRHLFVGAARGPQILPFYPSIRGLPDASFLEAVQARYGGLPEALFSEPELLELVMPVLRADFSAYETYQHCFHPSLSSPVTAFYGLQDTIVHAETVRPWAEITNGDFQLHPVDGDHFFLNASRGPMLMVIRETLVGAPGSAPPNVAIPEMSA